jgi:hypothetical protein
MSTDSEKLDTILEKVHSIDIRLNTLEVSLKGIPTKVLRLESDSKTVKSVFTVLTVAVPVFLVLLRWLGLSTFIQAFEEIK